MSNLPPLAVEMLGVEKRFGSVTANAGVSLKVARGTIHGIVGENGAGKSTAMHLLFGLHRPDAGKIFVDGVERNWRSPEDALAAGIGMVHQHFMLAGRHTALENIILGVEPTHRRVDSATDGRSKKGSRFFCAMSGLDFGRARSELEALALARNLPVPWDKPVDEMPVGLQQRVEILKALYRGVRILILDEPTAVLTPAEGAGLLAGLREFARNGGTVLLVTHKLKDVLAWTDHLTVFRAGRVVATMTTRETSIGVVAEAMMGRKIASESVCSSGKPSSEKLLEICNLDAGTVGKGLRDISMAVHAGEIVGIAGVEGNGQSELVDAILAPMESSVGPGRIFWMGKDAAGLGRGQLRLAGIAHIPADRIRDGVILEGSVQENFLLGHHRRPAFSRWGILKEASISGATSEVLQRHDVRTSGTVDPRRQTVASLSGGNQQKLVFGRELHPDPKFIVACQPTRGVDLGAAQSIRSELVRCRDRGAGVLLVSSDLEEILSLADRILVICSGQIVASYSRGDVNESELGLRMGGA